MNSSSGGWDHPMHVHFEEGIAIRQNGVNIAPQNRFRTDIHRLRSNKLEVFMQFRDFPDPNFAGRLGEKGRYVMHCHNIIHEDHAMMTTFNIVP
jgi:FtsP/CotA-like multicopper oxidase with cupredoxin domain